MKNVDLAGYLRRPAAWQNLKTQKLLLDIAHLFDEQCDDAGVSAGAIKFKSKNFDAVVAGCYLSTFNRKDVQPFA